MADTIYKLKHTGAQIDTAIDTVNMAQAKLDATNAAVAQNTAAIAGNTANLAKISMVSNQHDTSAYPISGSAELKSVSGLTAGLYLCMFSWQIVSSGDARYDVSIIDQDGKYWATSSMPASQSYPSITVVASMPIPANGKISANAYCSAAVTSNSMQFQVIRIA